MNLLFWIWILDFQNIILRRLRLYILCNFRFLILRKSETLLVNILIIINSLYIFLNTNILNIYFLYGITLLKSECILKCAEVLIEFILKHAVHDEFVELVSEHFFRLYITVYCFINEFIFWKPVFSKIHIHLIVIVKIVGNALLWRPIILNEAIIVLNREFLNWLLLIFIL